MKPFRHWVVDDALTPFDSYEPVPGPDWDGWEMRYNNAFEQDKRTTRRSFNAHVDNAVLALRDYGYANRWTRELGYPVLPDPTNWGGGFQVTGPGGVLATHLDFDKHPRLNGWRRALSLIGFLHPEWEDAWGGALCLCDTDGRVVERVLPKPGRLVAFENSDLAYHGVEPVTGPAERVSVMVNYLTPATAASVRTRAVFLPPRSS